MSAPDPSSPGESLAAFACPNPACRLFNRFNAGNLSIAERMGKGKAIRRLYCHACGRRFSERQGALLAYTKVPEDTVVRIIKCLGHGCSIEATADICEVDPRSVERMLRKAGRRAEDFHRLQLERLVEPLRAVELDELQAKVCRTPAKKGATEPDAGPLRRLLEGVAGRIAPGSMWPWKRWPGS